MTTETPAPLALAALRAYRARLLKRGRQLEARAVERCIEIVRAGFYNASCPPKPPSISRSRSSPGRAAAGAGWPVTPVTKKIEKSLDMHV
jgi:hypothetical protein